MGEGGERGREGGRRGGGREGGREGEEREEGETNDHFVPSCVVSLVHV